MKDEFLKARAGALSVTVAGGLDLTKMKFNNFTINETKNYVVCKRLTKWERLRLGGALMDLCHCPFCQGFATTIQGHDFKDSLVGVLLPQVFIDRPYWKLPISENPIPIREGMHLRAGWQRFYRVVRVNFRAEMVELQPMFDCQTLTLIQDPEVIEVSFEDVQRDYRPTMLGDGTGLKPLSRWERIQSGKLFQDPQVGTYPGVPLDNGRVVHRMGAVKAREVQNPDVNKAELDALREKVASEPEGSPARVLLAEVDRLNEASEQRAHAEMRQRLMKHDHLSEEEAEKVIGIFMTGNLPEMVMGPCRTCEGHGRVITSGCFGPRLGDRCPKCRGRGQSMQYKIPA